MCVVHFSHFLQVRYLRNERVSCVAWRGVAWRGVVWCWGMVFGWLLCDMDVVMDMDMVGGLVA